MYYRGSYPSRGLGTRGIICAEEVSLKTMIALESRLPNSSFSYILKSMGIEQQIDTFRRMFKCKQ